MKFIGYLRNDWPRTQNLIVFNDMISVARQCPHQYNYYMNNVFPKKKFEFLN